MTEHKLEKTSKYIETNPSKQPPKEEIRTISPHKNPNKNQPNSTAPASSTSLRSSATAWEKTDGKFFSGKVTIHCPTPRCDSFLCVKGSEDSRLKRRGLLVASD